MKAKSAPLGDVFATQGILVVLLCILLFWMHLQFPALCGDLLAGWYNASDRSPAIPANAAECLSAIQTWFSSVWPG
ncbi:MAG: hypothetical protein IJL32_04035 [Oscillospiraceae bacterium]|nr:hypothetical protein [Oscillospiraceae bacterium]